MYMFNNFLKPYVTDFFFWKNSRVMDCFLSEGIEVIFRLALALLLIGKQELLVQDIEGVIRVKKKYFHDR